MQRGYAKRGSTGAIPQPIPSPNPDLPTETFAETWATAPTGSILLVSGERELDSIMAKSIKLATRSPYSHVGILIRDPSEEMWKTYGRLRGKATVEGEPGEWGKGTLVPRDRKLYMFDSDYEEDGTVDGPVLRPLEDVLKAYLQQDYHGIDSTIVVRHLEASEAKKAEIQQKIEQFAISMAGRCFEAKSMTDGRFLQMLLSVWGGNKTEDLDRLFCSEVACACYKAAGFLRDSENASNYQPAHFEESRMCALGDHARLAREKRILHDELLSDISVTVKSAINVFEPNFIPGQVVDPYCKVKMADRKLFKTGTVNNSRNPTWNCTKEVKHDGVSDLSFSIWDDNYMPKTNREVSHDFHLKSKDFAHSGYDGEIKLKQDDGSTATLSIKVEIRRRSSGPYCERAVTTPEDTHDRNTAWSQASSTRLCVRGEEEKFRDKIPLLNEDDYWSVSTALDALNSSDGIADCHEGLCVVFSKSKESYYLLWRSDKKDLADEFTRKVFEAR